MRIISGKFRGRRLMPPKNITARPTTDFAKESLFNLLTNRMDLEGADVLDLFAGTGGIGLETFNQESAKFLYSYQENLPDELWLAPVYNEDEPADMSEAVLVRSAK